jgi:transcriptional regulator
MPRNELHGALDLLILKSMLQLGPAHGHGIAVHIRAASGQRFAVEDGSLYPALQRMEKNGWVLAFWSKSDARQRARYYKLTRKGRKQLTLREAKWHNVVEGVEALLRHA